MWFDDEPETRVGRDRVEELVETGAETIVTGCPFCLRMVSDGVAEREERPEIRDVAEVLVDAVLGVGKDLPGETT
jgi:Fe-S oxidoreductase